MRRGGAAALAATLLVAGCSGDDDEPVAAATPDPSATATQAGVVCSDGKGDSADPSLDLFDVRLARTGKDVRVVFNETETPEGDPVSWVVGFVSANGKHAVELTADVRKNGDIAHGITIDGEVRPVTDPVRITAEGMTTVFPVKPIDDLGKGVLWYATLSLDGEEIDYCPGGAELREVLDISPLALPERW